MNKERDTAKDAATKLAKHRLSVLEMAQSLAAEKKVKQQNIKTIKPDFTDTNSDTNLGTKFNDNENLDKKNRKQFRKKH